MKIIKPQSGIGLIEALIASVVFAIGIGAVLQLQSSFFKNSSAANARSIAMSIAQEKLEDLRSFKVKDDADADIFDFVAITTDAGGSCTEQTDDDICNVDLVAGNETRDNIVFTRNWAVTDYYKDNTGELTTTANANGIVQKRVVVTISWTDTDNTAQTASLDTVINQFSGISASGALASGAGGGGKKPTVPHTKLAAPDVIPTKLKTPPPPEYVGEPLTPEEIADEYAKSGYCNVETFAATESPDPDLDTNPELNNVIVRFTSTKYQEYTPCSFNASGDYTIEDENNIKTIKYSDEEFLTVNCSCELAASGPGKDQSGKLETKALTGTKTGAANQQTDFCDLCCRDHHENTTGENVCNSGSSLENCYDPYRSAASNFTSSDHKHYLMSNDSENAVGVGDEYLEVCRMKRIDGFYNVIQDWKLIAHTTLVKNELTDSSELTSYQSYIGTTVNNYLNEDLFTTWNATAPDVPTNETQMMSRSIYVDYMTAAEIAAAAPSGDTVDVLVPFYEYKTTLISDWTTTLTDDFGVAFDTGSPCSSGNSANGACVDSPSITAIVTANANSIPDKGIYRYGSTPPTADIKIVSTMTNSNSGVVAEYAIDPADNDSLSSGYTVAYGGTPPPVERSIQMTATELLACPNTWTGKSRSSIDIANWSAITLACSPEGTTTSCDGYADDQTVTVTATMNTATLGCTYAPNVGQKSCSTIQAATIPLLTGSLGCSVVLTKSGNNVECNLLCQP